MESQEVLIKPLMSEKGAILSERHNQVVFMVAVEANKYQIRSAIETRYGVEVKDVRTQVNRGKTKRRGASIGKRPNWKKALVTLNEGVKIDFFAAE